MLDVSKPDNPDITWHPASEHPKHLIIVEAVAEDGTITRAIWTGSDWRCAETGSRVREWRWVDDVTDDIEREPN